MTPAANSALAYGTTSLTLTVTTNQSATCYYGTAASPTTAMSTTGGTTHTQSVTVSTTSRTYYVRCFTDTTVDSLYSADTSRTYMVDASGKIVPDGSSIQSVTTANCTNAITFTGSNTGAIAKVYDARDNHYYAIAKLADGKCWMLSNLAYGGNLNNSGVAFGTMNHYTSGNGSSGWTSSTGVANAYYIDPTTDTGVTLIEGTRCAVSYRTTAAAITYTECGFLYNWAAATAMTGASVAANYGQATASICPVGWKLPTGYSTASEYALLNSAMNNSSITALAGTSSIFRGVFAGSFFPGTGMSNGLNSYMWSSNRGSSATYGLNEFFQTNGTNTTNNLGRFVYYGQAVRCIFGP
jgi:uncharacterized protein (TIGR02145 family)